MPCRGAGAFLNPPALLVGAENVDFWDVQPALRLSGLLDRSIEARFCRQQQCIVHERCTIAGYVRGGESRAPSGNLTAPTPLLPGRLNAYMVGAMAVDGLFALAVALRLKVCLIGIVFFVSGLRSSLSADSREEHKLPSFAHEGVPRYVGPSGAFQGPTKRSGLRE